MAIPVNITLADAKRGDRWQGISSIGPVLVNGAAPATPLTRVRIQFRKSGKLGITLDSEESEGVHPIEISDAETWLIHIPEIQPLPLSPGLWDWDAEFYEGDDVAPQTFYEGTMLVVEDITKP